MEYLLEMTWNDPVASALCRLCAALPAEVEQRDTSLPSACSHGFIVLMSKDPAALHRLAAAVEGAGATVRVVPAAGGEG